MVLHATIFAVIRLALLQTMPLAQTVEAKMQLICFSISKIDLLAWCLSYQGLIQVFHHPAPLFQKRLHSIPGRQLSD